MSSVSQAVPESRHRQHLWREKGQSHTFVFSESLVLVDYGYTLVWCSSHPVLRDRVR